MKQVNAIGDTCPLPVIKTKKALGEMVSGQLEVLVDNEIAVQNIQKLANSTGNTFKVDKQGEHFVIEIEKKENTQEALVATSFSSIEKTIVLISSDTMGSGDDELGSILIKGFVFALTQVDSLPDTILLYNSGAKLSAQGSAVLNDLIALEDAGVQIMTCGTCLNHFGIADALGVGTVTNMYTIVEEMRNANRILRP